MVLNTIEPVYNIRVEVRFTAFKNISTLLRFFSETLRVVEEEASCLKGGKSGKMFIFCYRIRSSQLMHNRPRGTVWLVVYY